MLAQTVGPKLPVTYPPPSAAADGADFWPPDPCVSHLSSSSGPNVRGNTRQQLCAARCAALLHIIAWLTARCQCSLLCRISRCDGIWLSRRWATAGTSESHKIMMKRYHRWTAEELAILAEVAQLDGEWPMKADLYNSKANSRRTPNAISQKWNKMQRDKMGVERHRSAKTIHPCTAAVQKKLRYFYSNRKFCSSKLPN